MQRDSFLLPVVVLSFGALGVGACSASAPDASSTDQSALGSASWGGIRIDTSAIVPQVWTETTPAYYPNNKTHIFIELPDRWGARIAFAAVNLQTRDVDAMIWVSDPCAFAEKNPSAVPPQHQQAPCTNPPSPTTSRCVAGTLPTTETEPDAGTPAAMTMHAEAHSFGFLAPHVPSVSWYTVNTECDLWGRGLCF